MCSILARISIAILLVRIFGVKTWLKWFLIAMTTLQVLTVVIVAITCWLQVRPAEGLWNPLIDAQRLDPNVVPREGNVAGGKSHSMLPSPIRYLGIHTDGGLVEGLFALGDLFYVLLPVIIVWKLNMPLSRKVGLCLLLAMSLFTMAASIAKAVAANPGTKSEEDAQYISSLALMWSVTEQAFVIMMGCAPPLHSITKLKLPSVSSLPMSFKRLVSSRGTGYELQDSRGYGQSSDGINTAELGVGWTDSGRGSSRDQVVYQPAHYR